MNIGQRRTINRCYLVGKQPQPQCLSNLRCKQSYIQSKIHSFKCCVVKQKIKNKWIMHSYWKVKLVNEYKKAKEWINKLV